MNLRIRDGSDAVQESVRTPYWRCRLLSALALIVAGCLSASLTSVVWGQERDSSWTTGALPENEWYDAESGTVRPVDVESKLAESANRDSRWLPQARRVRERATPTATGGTGGGNWSWNLFGTDFTLGNVIGWIVLLVILVGVVWMLVYAVSRAEFEPATATANGASRVAGPTDEQLKERIKHLPPELRRTDVNMRSEAERLMKEGAFDQAIILLFGHQLLLLDSAGLLRLTRGKTNGRYVREVKGSDRDTAKLLRGTADAFERSYFGRHTLTGPHFQGLWAANQMLEENLQKRREAA
ncbi:MAG: DUF4129 domain-containing protein [Planctomycetota bacterium]